MCGLCGAKHAPGEPHRAQRAADFNHKTGRTGVARVGGGYEVPQDSSRNLILHHKKNSIVSAKNNRTASQNVGGKSQRSLVVPNRINM